MDFISANTIYYTSKSYNNLESIVRKILVTLSVILAVTTLVTHFSQLVGIQYSLYCYLLFTIYVLIVAYFSRDFVIQLKEYIVSGENKKYALILLFTCLVGAILGLLSYRADADDFYYIPNVTFYIQNPQKNLDFERHFLFGVQDTNSYLWATAVPYEYGRSVLSYIFGIDYLDIYYFFTGTIFGFLIPASHFFLISQFTDDTKSTVLASLVSFSVLLLMGDTHATPGNYSLTRAYQGKSLLFIIGIPIFISSSLELLREFSFRSWLLVFSISTGLIGVSGSSSFLLFLLSLIILLSTLTTRYYTEGSIKIYHISKYAFSYISTLIYVVLFSLAYIILGSHSLGVESSGINVPTSFMNHYSRFFNPNQPVTFFVVSISTAASLIVISNRLRLFFVIWVSLLFVLVNPISDVLLIEYVTSKAYWRIFYISPLFIFMGISSLYISQVINSKYKQYEKYIWSSFLVISIIAHFPWFSSSTFKHKHHGEDTSLKTSQFQLQWFPLKYPLPGDYKAAKQIAEVTPKGPMLAPWSVGALVAIVDSGFLQARIRSEGIRVWSKSLSRAERRIKASKFIGGKDVGSNYFLDLLNESKICSIVIKNGTKNAKKSKKIVLKKGYSKTEKGNIKKYDVFFDKDRCKSKDSEKKN